MSSTPATKKGGSITRTVPTIRMDPSSCSSREAAAARGSGTDKDNSNNNKALRRRYKKLRKKATTVVVGPLSGILTAADWQEYSTGRDLYETTTATTTSNDKSDRDKPQQQPTVVSAVGGPQIRWRSVRYEQQQGTPIIEGAMQRDILYHLLQKNNRANHYPSGDKVEAVNENGKRKLPTQPANGTKVALPAWVTLHNTVGVKSVVLLELHVPTCAMLTSLQKQITAQFASSHHVLAAAVTRWFNNTTPKSIAECLLYAAPPKPPKRSKKQTATECIRNMTDLYNVLRCLCLTTEAMEKEGYPLDASNCSETSRSSLQSLSLSDVQTTPIPLEKAKSMIQPFIVKVKAKNGNDDEQQQEELYVASPNACTSDKDTTTTNNNKHGQIYALDCEMVQTAAGKALARFTLIQVKEYRVGQQSAPCTVVWDTLVQPDDQVTDYLTQYSGVSADMLVKEPTVRLTQVQAFLLQTLQPHDILVGHSLENDLQACRFIHRTCLDTAVLFRSTSPGRKFKYSLRNLTLQLLKRSIQQSNRAHCSQEDAQAALDLAVRRATEGPSFAMTDTRSLNQWATLAKDRTTVAVGPNAWLQKHITSQTSAVHALSCQGIDDTSRKAVLAWIGSRRRADLVWACFELKDDSSDEKALVDFLVEIMNKAPSEDTVIGVALQSQHAPCTTMFQHRRARQSGKATLGWTTEEEKRFTELATESQQGSMVWLSSKN